MANEQSRSCKSSSLPSHAQILVRGVPFTLDVELLALKSARISTMVTLNAQGDLSNFLRDLPTDPTTFELFARFCHGFEASINTNNVVQVYCLAHHLEMTEKHCPGNLLNKCYHFFKRKILPSWNETVKAIRAADCLFQQAFDIGLIEACMKSIIMKAMSDPHLIGEPFINSFDNDEEDDDYEERYKPNVCKKLFALDWKPEDITNLSLRMYKMIIEETIVQEIPSQYLAASLCQYAKKWVFTCTPSYDATQNMKSTHQQNLAREVIEAIETLLPEQGLVPCTILFKMLRYSIVLEASDECQNGLEEKIGKQLQFATVRDLLIPSEGYAKEVQYDVECVKRIVKHFYANYNCASMDGLVKVAELIEEFLEEIASDIDLKPETFTLVADMSAAASSGANLSSDGVYRAIDIYLDKHRYLTESEKEDICNTLDCQKLSQEACEHAAKNKLFPLRVVVQVLFMSQLQLRGAIMKEVENSERAESSITVVSGEAEVRTEMEKMGNRVKELKKECGMIKNEIQNDKKITKDNNNNNGFSVWNQLKKKFGCSGSLHDGNKTQDSYMIKKMKKKVHPTPF